MAKFQWLILMALPIAMVSLNCNRRSNRNAEEDLAKVQAAIQKYDEGFRNLTFKIQDYKAQADGSHHFLITCITPGAVGGFEVVISKGFLTPVKFDSPVTLELRKGTVSFHSTGINSDAFIKYLAKKYDTNLHPQKFKELVKFRGTSAPLVFEKGFERIKISYGEGGTPDFAAASLDIDLPAKRFDFNENNPEYRIALVHAMAAF